MKILKNIEREIESLRKSNPRQFFYRIKKVGARIGECEKSGFTIPAYTENNLSSEEEANKIAEFFSKISREFEPLDRNILPKIYFNQKQGEATQSNGGFAQIQ